MITYDDIRDRLPGGYVRIIQRLGVEPDGTPLRPDGRVGWRTSSARYLDPLAVTHPVAAQALIGLLCGAEESGAHNSGWWPERVNGGGDEGAHARWRAHPWRQGAWCAGYVSWCLLQAYGGAAPYILGAQRLGRAVADQGLRVGLTQIQPGDLLVWDRDGPDPGDDPGNDMSGHIGILAAIHGNYAWAIEANTGPRGAVRAYRYDRRTVEGMARGDGSPYLHAARWLDE